VDLVAGGLDCAKDEGKVVVVLYYYLSVLQGQSTTPGYCEGVDRASRSIQ
jgi:hypothetical protein